ncbi:hypothetical protein [Nocardioides solisilvae]|uniref:hypothetical protein n=1 Tax=Nocardioides solisilvae TaxID=1542435 RepID=UPI000D74F65F|nr:hypothetical protein [Nocardioides solisilvae]
MTRTPEARQRGRSVVEEARQRRGSVVEEARQRRLETTLTTLTPLALTLLLTACTGEPDPEESRAALSAAQERAEGAFRGAIDALEPAGFSVGDGEGEWRTCGVDPLITLQVFVDGSLSGGEGDVAARVAAAAEALESDGWEIENADETPRPYAILVDGDDDDRVRVSVLESKFEPGTLGLGISGACVESDSETSGEQLAERFTVPGGEG